MGARTGLKERHGRAAEFHLAIPMDRPESREEVAAATDSTPSIAQPQM